MTDTDAASSIDETAAADGPTSGAEGPGSRADGAPREGRGRSGVLMAVVSGVALAGIGGTIAFGIMWAQDRSQASDQAAARAVASRFLLDLTNFTPNTLKADFSDMQGMATGAFAKQAKRFFSSSIRSQLAQAQAQTQGRILHLYAQSSSASSASFFGDVTQTFRNNLSPQVHSDELRVVVDLSKVGGQWKVSQVTTIGAGGSTGGSPTAPPAGGPATTPSTPAPSTTPSSTP